MDCLIYYEFFIDSIEKNSIVIYNDQGYCSCETKNNPNDIFESGNIIVTVGRNIMEVFEFSQNNNDNDNNNNKLIKKYEINIDNNNNFNNDNFINNNNNSDNEIMCITLAQNFVVCGHASGLMSIWQPVPETYLKRLQGEKMHNGSINKILHTQLSDNKNYLISCSSDKTIKVYCMEDNKVVKENNFEDEVMDIKRVKDFDNKIVFIVSLKNGILKGLDELFNELFIIPSRFKTSTTRYVISLKNEEQNNNNNTMNHNNSNNNKKGDLLLITEGKMIDVFTWIKEGMFAVKHAKPNQHPYKGNNPFPHSQHNPYFLGPQFYPRGGFHGQKNF